MANYAVATIIVLTIILIGLLLFRPSITAAQGGKILAFIAFFILPIVATFLGASIHLENSKVNGSSACLATSWRPTGKVFTLMTPPMFPLPIFKTTASRKSKPALPVIPITRCSATCTAKMRGLKHIYVYYLNTPPAKLALYEPFKNRECLHCHAGARSFEETTPHKEMKEQLTANDMSCLTCHNKIHDVANIDKTKQWKGPVR